MQEADIQEADIHEYARQLLEARGATAIADAAQKARSFEQQGNGDEARTWRRIGNALKLMRGPRQS
jgi:hypothetical protein